MKILIISYYYPPCNSVASYRPKSFADYFSKFNDVKVITRQWSGSEKNWSDYLQSNHEKIKIVKRSDKLEEIYLPYKSRVINNRFFSFINTILRFIKGEINYEVDTLQFEKYIHSIIPKWKPDFILVSSPPLNLLKLADSLFCKYGIQFVADFRDYENEFILNRNPPKNFKKKLLHKIYNHFTKKYLKNCDLICTASPPISEFFESINLNTITITNGFETDVFNSCLTNLNRNEKFTLSMIGTIYPNQNLNVIIEGFKLFLEKHDDVSINFVGVNAIEKVAKEIKVLLPMKNINITDRIPKEQALNYMKRSDILFYIGWNGYKGVYSGKIFEYLGSRKNILIAPSDNDVIEELLHITKTGEVANSASEVFDYLEKKYTEWKDFGFVKFNGLNNKIDFYTRENQARLLLDRINLINSKR